MLRWPGIWGYLRLLQVNGKSSKCCVCMCSGVCMWVGVMLRWPGIWGYLRLLQVKRLCIQIMSWVWVFVCVCVCVCVCVVWCTYI